MPAGRIVVVGIGNPDRGDDAIGHEVVRLLRGRMPAGIEALHRVGEATELLAAIEGADTAIFVDAAVFGATPGEVRRFDAGDEPLPSNLTGLSSHGLGLAEAIELARALGSLPRRCIVYAVECGQLEPGTPLSADVAAAAASLANRILDELTSEAG